MNMELVKKISPAFFLMLSCAAADVFADTKYSFNFINRSGSDVYLEAMNQSAKPGNIVDNNWSSCMGSNWFTPHPAVKILAGRNYSVSNVNAKHCNYATNTWKVSYANSTGYGYVKFFQAYTMSVNKGAISAEITNFNGPTGTSEPAKGSRPRVTSARCNWATSSYDCFYNYIVMRKGGGIDIVLQ